MVYRFAKPGCDRILLNQASPVCKVGCSGLPGDLYIRQGAFSAIYEITLKTPGIALAAPLPQLVNGTEGTETIVMIEMIFAANLGVRT